MFPIFVPPVNTPQNNNKKEKYLSLNHLTTSGLPENLDGKINNKSKQNNSKDKNPLGGLAFLLVMFISFVSKTNMSPIYVLAIIVAFIILISIKQINQYERGVRFSLGKYTGMMAPGWRLVLPIFQSYRKVDLRLKAVDVPDQETITKDNISCKVNAVIYYKVSSAEKAVIEVENYRYAVSQLAQTTMRNAVGEVELDELLSQRDKVADNIRSVVDASTDPWGIKVESVELKDVVLPEEMKRVIGKQAEAEREKRSVIIKAEGEVAASQNLSTAAKTLAGSPGALHLRTLASINDLSSDQSNTVIFALPLEILKAFSGFNGEK
jgi:regulator of protease activity HflC (stomatin/prohibitin superfamily)